MSTTKLDTWRLRELVDEPLYCAAPAPKNADGTCCYDSDEELDSSTRLAKRLRYEAAGRRFLSGQRPRLLSASLRGPFDVKSGWRNPWLRKPSHDQTLNHIVPGSGLANQFERRPQNPTCDTPSAPLTTKDSSVAIGAPSSPVDGDTSYTTPNVHIPEKKRLEIQVWADNIETGLTDDDQGFWNPLAKTCTHDEVRNQTTGSTQTKNGWLKKTPLKRKRSGPQPRDIASVVGKPSQLLRSTSDSATLQSRIPAPMMHQQEMSSLLKSRSFELTTPSSLADPPPIMVDQDIAYETHSASDVTSNCGSATPRGHLIGVGNKNDGVEGCSATQQMAIEDCDDLGDNQISHRKIRLQGMKHVETQVESQAGGAARSRTSRTMAKEKPEGNSHAPAQILTQTETPESSHHPDEVLTPMNCGQSEGAQQIFVGVEPMHQSACQTLSGVIVAQHQTPQPIELKELNAIKQETTSEDSAENDAEQIEMSRTARQAASRPDSTYNYTQFMQSIQLGHAPQPARLTCKDDIVRETTTNSQNKPLVEIKIEFAERVPSLDFASLQTIAISASQLSELVSCTEDQNAMRGDVEFVSTIYPNDHDALPDRADCTEIEESVLVSNSTHEPLERETTAIVATKSLQTDIEASITKGNPDTEVAHVEEADATSDTSFVLPSQQSPWASCDQSILLPVTSGADLMRAILTEDVSPDTCQSLLTPASPTTPPRSTTTTTNLGLKSFSRFNTPSPQRRSAQENVKRHSTGQLRSILSTKTSRRRSHSIRRCVSFAPLPGDIGEESDAPQTRRAASPPPVTTPAIGDEDVSDQFLGHFSSMKRKKAGTQVDGTGRPHRQQLYKASAPVEQGAVSVEPITDSIIGFGTSRDEQEEHANDITAMNEPQSPWRDDTQSDMVDDVAAVMGNLDAFLDAWSVEHEIQKTAQPEDQENRSREQSKMRTSGNRFGLQELSIWN